MSEAENPTMTQELQKVNYTGRCTMISLDFRCEAIVCECVCSLYLRLSLCYLGQGSLSSLGHHANSCLRGEEQGFYH